MISICTYRVLLPSIRYSAYTDTANWMSQIGGTNIVIFKIFTCDDAYYLADCGVECSKDSRT